MRRIFAICILASLLVVGFLCSGAMAQEPDLALTQEQIAQSRDAVFGEIGQIRATQGNAGLLVYLQSLNLGALDLPEAGESADAQSGASLSKPFFGVGASLTLDKLFAGRHIVRTADEYNAVIRLALLFSELQDTNLAEVTDWFASRTARAPATRVDRVIAFLASGDFSGLPASYWLVRVFRGNPKSLGGHPVSFNAHRYCIGGL